MYRLWANHQGSIRANAWSYSRLSTLPAASWGAGLGRGGDHNAGGRAYRLGNGDPGILFAPEKEPLTRQDLETCLQRAAWSRAEIIALVHPLSEEEIEAKPARGRAIKGILEHLCAAEYSYIRHFGKLPGVRGPGLHIQRAKEELLAWMAVLRASEISLLQTLDVHALAAGSSGAHNPRRILRRLLEHEWEHLVEMKQRLQVE